MIGDIFTWILIDPMINFLVFLSNILWGSFGLALIAFTFIIRGMTAPLTMRQVHQTRALQALNPRIQEINKKYNDPKRRQQEIMAAYREAGVNPLGCLGPFVLQFPIMIALYIAVRYTLPESPEALVRLGDHLYHIAFLERAIPLENEFLGIDLREPFLPLVLLVAATTYIQSKTTVTVATDERARAQQQMMTVMMPLMMGFFALSLPSGVSLYWVTSAIVSIAVNVVIYGVPALKIQPLMGGPRTTPAPPVGAPAAALAPAQETRPTPQRTTHGSGRSKRPNRRRRS